MSTPTTGRLKRIALKITKAMVVLGAALVLLAALAYKNVIPGGPELVDTAEAVRIVWRRRAFVREAASVPAGAVVFFGSSSVDSFPFAALYPGAPWLNRGLNTETAKDLADRLEATMPAARPSGVVVWTGMNDLRAESQPADVVVERVTRVLDLVAGVIAARYPGVAVAVVEILPTCDTKDEYLERLHQVNRQLAELAKERGIAFVRTDRPPLTTPEGRLSPLLAARDRKHLNFAGYSVLSKWLVEDGGAATAALAPR